MFRMLGVCGYDTDAQAKRLMSCDAGLAAAIEECFGKNVFACGVLDRAALAKIVFNDAEALSDLERIVHPAVTADFLKWAALNGGDAGYVIAESAILFESGMDVCMDFTVTVSAPERLRLERAMMRDAASAEKISERMAHQMTDTQREDRVDYIIYNDEHTSVWRQVIALDTEFRAKAAERIGL